MSIKRIPQLTIIFLALLVIGLGVRYTETSTVPEPTLYDIRDKLEAPYDPVDRVATLGRKNEIGDLTTCRIAVSCSSDTIDKRGYTTVYCLGHMNIAYQEGYNNIVLLNQDSTPITYPLNPEESKLAYRLKEVLNSRYVNFRGELYNCSAWDGSWFLGLKVGNEKIFTIRYDPKPLDDSQFTLMPDRSKYVSDGTAKISIYNWSEDWLNTGHCVDLYKWLNGTWAKVETEWVVSANIIMFFPGTSFTENIPLSELAPGEYKITKQVWRDYKNQFTVEAQFSIVEPVTIDPQHMENSPFNLFAFDLFNQIYEEGENLVFSPTSIHQVLGMIHEGARNETAEEMRQVLYLPVNDTLRREAYRVNMVPPDQVETANAVWIDEHYPVLEEYMDVITEYFMGEAENIDYSNAEQARGIINQWAENRTHGRITELLPENSINSLDTRLVLTNAIYFQGAWKYTFNSSLTEEVPFMVDENRTVMVDMMKLTSRSDVYPYTNDSMVEMVRLPYKHCNMSMYIILPFNGTVEKTLEYLTAERFNQLIDNLESEMFDLYIPRFQFNNEYRLKDNLRDMGMNRVFGDADLSGINGEKGLAVSEVYHQAFIDVNEEGTEASAATAGVISIGMKHEPFVANHPFIFIIRDDHKDTILFMGAVNDPTQ